MLRLASVSLGVSGAWWLLDMPSLWVEGAGAVQTVSLGGVEVRSQSSSVQALELGAFGSEQATPDGSPSEASIAVPPPAPSRKLVATVATNPSPPLANATTQRTAQQETSPSILPEVPRPRPSFLRVRGAADSARRADPVARADGTDRGAPSRSAEPVAAPPAKPSPSAKPSPPAKARASARRSTAPSEAAAKLPPAQVELRPLPRSPLEPRSRESATRAQRVVQVAASGHGQRAQNLAAELRRRGFDSYVFEVQDDPSGLRYKVRVRPQGGEAARDLVERLRRGGRDGWITTQ